MVRLRLSTLPRTGSTPIGHFQALCSPGTDDGARYCLGSMTTSSFRFQLINRERRQHQRGFTLDGVASVAAPNWIALQVWSVAKASGVCFGRASRKAVLTAGSALLPRRGGTQPIADRQTLVRLPIPSCPTECLERLTKRPLQSHGAVGPAPPSSCKFDNWMFKDGRAGSRAYQQASAGRVAFSRRPELCCKMKRTQTRRHWDRLPPEGRQGLVHNQVGVQLA